MNWPFWTSLACLSMTVLTGYSTPIALTGQIPSSALRHYHQVIRSLKRGTLFSPTTSTPKSTSSVSPRSTTANVQRNVTISMNNVLKEDANAQNLVADLMDPELKSLNEKITAGLKAQEELKSRLKLMEKDSHRLAHKKISFMGDSWKKPAAKQLGVRTNFRSSSKRRSEGKLKKKSHKPRFIKIGRAGAPSPIISKRFFDENSAVQVQVKPSEVIAELTESLKRAMNRVFSAGPIAKVENFDEHVVMLNGKQETLLGKSVRVRDRNGI